jgi:hypothetical protein
MTGVRFWRTWPGAMWNTFWEGRMGKEGLPIVSAISPLSHASFCPTYRGSHALQEQV